MYTVSHTDAKQFLDVRLICSVAHKIQIGDILDNIFFLIKI